MALIPPITILICKNKKPRLAPGLSQNLSGTDNRKSSTPSGASPDRDNHKARAVSDSEVQQQGRSPIPEAAKKTTDLDLRNLPLPSEPIGNWAIQAGFDLAAIESVPSDPAQSRVASGFITRDILVLFDSRLAPDDRALWRLGTWTNSIVKVLDQVIIEKAQILGWRIYLSPHVLNRMAEWHVSGAEGIRRLEQLGQGVSLAARVAHGKGKLPLVEREWYSTRKQALNEVKALCKRLNAIAIASAKLPKGDDLHALIRSEIETPGRYQLLRANTTSFFTYLKQQDLDQGGHYTVQLMVRGSRVTPADIVNGWFDWSSGTSEGQSRKIISTIGGQKRR